MASTKKCRAEGNSLHCERSRKKAPSAAPMSITVLAVNPRRCSSNRLVGELSLANVAEAVIIGPRRSLPCGARIGIDAGPDLAVRGFQASGECRRVEQRRSPHAGTHLRAEDAPAFDVNRQLPRA